MTLTRLRELAINQSADGVELEASTLIHLLDTIDCLKAALEDAADTIHDEFCGSNGHHPLCDKPRAALAKLSEEE